MFSLAVCLLLLLFAPALTYELTPKADFVLGKRVPDITLEDHRGNILRLSHISDGQPLLVSLIYTRCSSSCPVIVERLKEALTRIDNRNYRVLLIDFDERDTRAELLKFVEQRAIKEPWIVALAKGEELKAFLRSVDFRYVYDEKTDMFYHPNVLIVLSPELRISGYILGLSFPKDKLEKLISIAERNEVNLNPIKSIILSCFRYDPISGKYSLDWSFVAMLIGGIIPFTFMFYFIVVKGLIRSFRGALS